MSKIAQLLIMTRFRLRSWEGKRRQRKKSLEVWKLNNQEHRVLKCSSSKGESTEKNYRRWQNGRYEAGAKFFKWRGMASGLANYSNMERKRLNNDGFCLQCLLATHFEIIKRLPILAPPKIGFSIILFSGGYTKARWKTNAMKSSKMLHVFWLS